MQYCASSIIGARKNQEDFGDFKLYQNGQKLVSVLADGMGGHAAGEVASQIAVDTFLSIFLQNTMQGIVASLEYALLKANIEIKNQINKNPSHEGMGSTLLAVSIADSNLNWISVGDSQLYLYRRSVLKKLNQDHSMAPVIEASLAKGKLSLEEAKTHPQRNALRSALMGGEIPLIDLPKKPLELHAGDLLLLATDGILTLEDSEISKILFENQSSSAKYICDSLLKEVENRQKIRQDNTTIQIIIIDKSNHFFTPKNYRPLLISCIAFFILFISIFFFWNSNPIQLFSTGTSFEKNINAQNIPSKESSFVNVVPSPLPGSELEKATGKPPSEASSNNTPLIERKDLLPSVNSKNEVKEKSKVTLNNSKAVKTPAKTNDLTFPQNQSDQTSTPIEVHQKTDSSQVQATAPSPSSQEAPATGVIFPPQVGGLPIAPSQVSTPLRETTQRQVKETENTDSKESSESQKKNQ
jgi:serine/threonine protein phosphatase PrpC